MRRALLVTSFSLVVLLSGATSIVAASFTVTTIDVPGARRTVALGINDRGQIVGWFEDSSGVHGFIRSKGQFTVIDFPGSTETQAQGINNRSQIVGSYVVNGAAHGFLLDGGRFTTVEPPNATFSSVWGINDFGQLVGQSGVAGNESHGFLWTHGQFVTIDVLPGSESGGAAFGINGLDQVVGRYADTSNRVHGFRWEPRGDFTTIDAPGASFTQPNGINVRGEIVGERLDKDGIHGFLLAYGIFTTIDISGSIETIAAGINNRGQIVGEYIERSSGIPGVHGFVATPPNEVEDDSGNPSADRTRVPLVPVIFDIDLSAWSIGAGQEILHDGVQAAGGYGSQILWYQGSIYVLGDDSNWWKWTGSTWSFAGPNDPSS